MSATRRPGLARRAFRVVLVLLVLEFLIFFFLGLEIQRQLGAEPLYLG